MIARIRSAELIQHPTLAPYRPQRSAIGARRRKAALLTVVVLIGAIYGFLISILPIAFYLYLAAPIVVMALLVIWALPRADTYPEKTIERLFFAIFASSFIWPNYLAIAIPGLPWITVIRLLSLPLAAILLVSLSISDVFRRQLAEPFKTSPVLLRLMLAFVAIQLLTLPFSSHLAGSLNRLIDTQLAWTLSFFVAAYVFGKEGRARRWVTILCAISVFLCLLAVPEYRQGQVLWADKVPRFFNVNDELVQKILAGGRRSATNEYRVQSIFATSLNFAEFLAFTTPFFLYLLTVSRSLWMRAGVLAYLPFSFYIILTTDSRLGVVGFFMACIVYAFLWAIRTWRLQPRDLFSPAVVLSYPAFATAFLILTFAWQRLKNVFWGGGAEAASNEGRMEQWNVGLPKILNWPIGHGIGESGYVLGHVDVNGDSVLDNYFLAIGLEYGILGFLAYFGLMVAGVWQATRYALTSRSKDAELLVPAAVMLAVFIVIKGVLAQDDSHVLIFMGLGMVAALAHRVAQQPSATGKPA